jgi:hypothetical protein
MGTRCVITFKDEYSSHSVYRHYDGDPETIFASLQEVALTGKAWTGPRFEADEFAAAYVATHKTGPGNIRLTKGPRAHGDLSFEYVVYATGDNIVMKSAEAYGKRRWRTATFNFVPVDK